jgi:hypothetical protein
MTPEQFSRLTFRKQAELAKADPKQYRTLRAALQAKRAELRGISMTASTLAARSLARAQLAGLQPAELGGIQLPDRGGDAA